MQARMTSDFDLSMSKAVWPIHLAISSFTLKVMLTSAAMLLSPISNGPWIETESGDKCVLHPVGCSLACQHHEGHCPSHMGFNRDVTYGYTGILQKKRDYILDGIAALHQILEICFFMLCEHVHLVLCCVFVPVELREQKFIPTDCAPGGLLDAESHVRAWTAQTFDDLRNVCR